MVVFPVNKRELFACQIAQLVYFLEGLAKTTFDNDTVDLHQIWMESKNDNIRNSIQISVFGVETRVSGHGSLKIDIGN